MDSAPLFLESELLRRAGVRHGFGIRTGGVSKAPFDSLNVSRTVGDDPAAVEENLRRFAVALGTTPAAIATVHQVHGATVAFAGEDGALRAEPDAPPVDAIEADAVVAARGRAAGVRTADCVPVLLYDARTGAAAAVHAGWRGTVANVVGRAVEALGRWQGAKPSDLLAAIGPAIGPCCFVVGEEVAARFVAHSSLGPGVVATGSHPPRIDLAESNRRLLQTAGVRTSQIEILRHCTACETSLFFSHRRDAERTGRHLSAIRARTD